MLIRFILKRIMLFMLVLLVINALSYMLVNYLELRGPMAFGYRLPDVDIPIADVVSPYPDYLRGILHGDLGAILRYGRDDLSVLQLMARGLPKSLILLGVAVILSLVVGLAIGLLSVNYKARRTSLLALVFSLGGFSMPGFYLSILALALMFQMALSKGRVAFSLPVSGYGLDAHLILPVLTLAARPTAEIARLTAELLVEELPKNYIRTARAKGLPRRRVILRHAFRNVAGAVVTAFSNSLSYLIGGLVITERVFNWGGIGEALIDSITFNQFAGSSFDPAHVASLATAVALLFLLADLVTEMAAQIIDPRLRRIHGRTA